jgi:hypothetical protein
MSSYNEFSEEDGYSSVLFYGYLGIFIVISLGMAAVTLYGIYKLREEWKNDLLDVYRIIQYSFLFLYTTFIVVSDGMRFSKQLEMLNVATLLYLCLGYYFSELINIL